MRSNGSESLASEPLRQPHNTSRPLLLNERSYSTVQLRRRQEETFGAIQVWANAKFGFTLATSESLFHTQQPADVSLAYAHHLHALPSPQLLGVTELAGACKSLLLALAIHGGQLSAAEVRTRGLRFGQVLRSS
jgi:chaperone required for assembly of F1-ATPase